MASYPQQHRFQTVSVSKLNHRGSVTQKKKSVQLVNDKEMVHGKKIVVLCFELNNIMKIFQ